jgi:hypothetical protein
MGVRRVRNRSVWLYSLGLVLALAMSGCQRLGPGEAAAIPTPPTAVESTPEESPAEEARAYGHPINVTVAGVTCFRGNPERNYYGDELGHGTSEVKAYEIKWRSRIGENPGGHWAGVGWTGQPLIIEWTADTRRHMNFLRQPGPEAEVIVGGLDGQVHFFDAATGQPSRRPLAMPGRYPIKGTVSLDPRGYPLLYVGCGLNSGPAPGFRIYSLLDFRELLYLPGYDKAAPRRWPASDSNPLVLDDVLYFPAENGLFYKVKLNADWDAAAGLLKIQPAVERQAVTPAGVESSMAVWNGFGYFGDNAGAVWRIDLNDIRRFKKLVALGDDTDSTIVFDQDGSFYVGIEKDKRSAASAPGRIFKIRAADGKILWTYDFPAQSITRVALPGNPINGGILSTGALDSAAGMIFYTTAHDPKIRQGRLIALDTKHGRLLWELQLAGYSWSSPVVVGGIVVAFDSTGAMYIVSSRTGESLLADDRGHQVRSLNVGANVESSPIVWKGRIYVGIRGGALVCIGPVDEEQRPTILP